MTEFRRARLLACVSVISMLPTNMVLAQQTAASTAAPSSAETIMQDIVVTARKKSVAERAQNVPIALTAVNGAQIDATFSRNLTDIGMSMPNVRLDDGGAFPGVANYTIRGMGFNSTIASVDPTVATFVDGQYIGTNLGGLQDTLDLESVEVLRGPQGTLFGRNVTGGAVVMRSKRPTGEFGGLAKLEAGSGNLHGGAAAIEGPISSNLSAKLYARYSDTDGNWRNLTTGKRHGADETYAFRPMIRWRPDAAVDITVIGEYGHTDGDGVASRLVDNPNQLLNRNGFFQPPSNARDLTINFDGQTNIRWGQAVVDATWNVGPGAITSITGYRNVQYFSTGDTDGSASETARAINIADQHQFSQELRYAGKALDDKLDYTIGAYYFQQRVQQFYHVYFFGASNQRSEGILHHKTASVFAQGDYEFLHNVFLTLGGRYTWERKAAENARTPNCDLQLNCVLSDSGHKSFHNFSPKVGLSWKITPDVLLYASYTKGFRSGGYNIRTTGANELAGPYNQEVARAYEGGVKTEFLNHHARVNLAGFHNEFSGLQRTVNQGLVNFIANVASATINGVEVETTLLPIHNLALTANVGYLDAKYDDYVLPGTTTNLAGKQLVRAPKWSWSASATYDLAIDHIGTFSNRVAVDHSSKTPADDPGNYFAPPYTLLDASISWTPEGNKRIKVSIYGKNLTNKLYALTATYVSTLFTNLYQAPPRSYGGEIVYKF